jgi:effector-binding domain-containing protein
VLSADDVIVRAEPMRRLVSLRRTVPSFNAARELMLELQRYVRRHLSRGLPRTLIAIAHSPQFEQDEIDVELGYLIENNVNVNLPNGSNLTMRDLESVERMAVCVRIGLPEDAHLVTAKIGRFLEASGDRIAGATREVFLEPPDLERMHEAVVEMQFPIQSQAVA